MFLEYYFYYLYYTFLGYPFIIRVAVAGSLLFFFVFLLIIITILYNAYSQNKKRKFQKKIDKFYTGQLRIIITSYEDFTEEDVKRMLSGRMKKLSDRHKRILTNRIINIRNKSLEVNMKNYRKVVSFFELQSFWEKKLKYGSLPTKLKALRKSDDLDIDIPGAIISPLTYNRNPYLRRKARSYYMYFSNNSPYKFMDENFDSTFNNWDCIELHRMLCRRRKEGLPSFSQWIKKSDNSKFICFLIDEIAFFNQEENAVFLTELIQSHDIEIRKHSIEALGALKYEKAEDVLRHEYVTQPVSVQESIISTIGMLNTGNSLSFLKEAYYSATTSELRIVVLKAIYQYGEAGNRLFQSLKQNTIDFERLIFEHVSDPLINKYQSNRIHGLYN